MSDEKKPYSPYKGGSRYGKRARVSTYLTDEQTATLKQVAEALEQRGYRGLFRSDNTVVTSALLQALLQREIDQLGATVDEKLADQNIFGVEGVGPMGDKKQEGLHD